MSDGNSYRGNANLYSTNSYVYQDGSMEAQMSYRKIGGLYFFKIGRFGITLWWSKRHV